MRSEEEIRARLNRIKKTIKNTPFYIRCDYEKHLEIKNLKLMAKQLEWVLTNQESEVQL